MYAYADGNPVNWIDPNGKFFFLFVAPAAYTGTMALVDLTIAIGMSYSMQHAINKESWHDIVDYDNWPFGQKYFYPKLPDPEQEKREKAEDDCHDECVDEMSGNRCNQGIPYTNCMKKCMAEKGYLYP